MGQNPVSFFCPFPITISIVQIEKSVDCARDSNLQQQDGRRRRYRGTMAAAQTFVAKNFQEIAQSGHTGGGVDDFLSSSSLHLPNNLGSSESCFLLLLLNKTTKENNGKNHLHDEEDKVEEKSNIYCENLLPTNCLIRVKAFPFTLSTHSLSLALSPPLFPIHFRRQLELLKLFNNLMDANKGTTVVNNDNDDMDIKSTTDF